MKFDLFVELLNGCAQALSPDELDRSGTEYKRDPGEWSLICRNETWVIESPRMNIKIEAATPCDCAALAEKELLRQHAAWIEATPLMERSVVYDITTIPCLIYLIRHVHEIMTVHAEAHLAERAFERDKKADLLN